jgi:hypothetical protein
MMIETQSRNEGMQLGKLRDYRGSDPLWVVLLFGTLLFISSMTEAAADMRGDQFITMMDGIRCPAQTLPGRHSTSTSCRADR